MLTNHSWPWIASQLLYELPRGKGRTFGRGKNIQADFLTYWNLTEIHLWIIWRSRIWYLILLSSKSSICRKTLKLYSWPNIAFGQWCDPMLVTEPNVVWLLVTVLVAVVFMTTTFASDCLLLSSPSVPTLCLKDPWREVDAIQPDLLLMVR